MLTAPSNTRSAAPEYGLSPSTPFGALTPTSLLFSLTDAAIEQMEEWSLSPSAPREDGMSAFLAALVVPGTHPYAIVVCARVSARLLINELFLSSSHTHMIRSQAMNSAFLALFTILLTLFLFNLWHVHLTVFTAIAVVLFVATQW